MTEPEHLLYITSLPEDKIAAVKAVRKSMELMGGDAAEATLSDCHDIVGFVAEDGFTYIGSVATKEEADAIVTALGEVGATVEVNKDVLAEAHATVEEERAEGDFSKRVSQTALGLLGWHNGDPIPACAQTSMLARTSGFEIFYEAVLNHIIETFPWIEGPLRENGVIE